MDQWDTARGVDLVPKPAHLDVGRVRSVSGTGTPEELCEHGAWDDLTLMAQQVLEEQQLARSKRELAATAGRDAPLWIEHEIGSAEHHVHDIAVLPVNLEFDSNAA